MYVGITVSVSETDCSDFPPNCTNDGNLVLALTSYQCSDYMVPLTSNPWDVQFEVQFDWGSPLLSATIKDVPYGTWYLTGFWDSNYNATPSSGTVYPDTPDFISDGDGMPWCPQVVVAPMQTPYVEFELNQIYYGE